MCYNKPNCYSFGRIFMQKKVLSILISLLTLSICTFALTACIDMSSPHTHVFDKEVSTNEFLFKEATCEDAAEYYYSCSCGEKGETTFNFGEELGHDYSNWVSNGNGSHTKTCANDSNHTITENCSGGTASCTQKAICIDCGLEYGSLENHNYTELKKSETQHWYECVCGDKIGVTDHVPGAEATETTNQTCTECDYVITPALGHVHTLHLTKVQAKQQSCTTEGNIEYYACSCDKWFTDNTATTEITDKSSVVIEKEEHQYTTLKKSTNEHWWECVCGDIDGLENHHGGTASCTQKAICVDCNLEYGSLKDHNYTEPKKSETHHWYECVCGDKQGEEAHKGGEATCTQKATCSVCSTEYGEAKGHNYDEEVTAPTCTEQGFTKYSCDCGHSYCDNYVDELGHTDGEWVTDTNATCIAEGSKRQICSVCSATLKTEAIPQTEHSYKDNVCTTCGDEIFSQGLEYEVEFHKFIGNYCVITGIGTCLDKDIVIPSKINNMPVKTIGQSAFLDVDFIETVTLSRNVNIIQSDAFLDCDNLKKISMPSISTIEDYAFGRCVSLTEVVLPRNLNKIGVCAFAMCTSLETIVIPDSVIQIQKQAFLLCNSLTIYCELDSTPFGWDSQWNQLNYDDSYCVTNWNYRAEGDTRPIHNFSEWYVEVEATETEGRIMGRTCQICWLHETYAFEKKRVSRKASKIHG